MKLSVAATPMPRPAEPLMNRTTWLLLAACVGIFLLLRIRWIGHLLVWDEAMALCTARAFSTGADDPFAGWFWRHPPLHSLLLLILQPMRSGFAERAEFLSIAFGVVNQVLLFFLNRRAFGQSVGLWSALLIALLPGAAFFDVWIKQDTLVTTFGLLALLALGHRRTLLCGICLGLALLTKGTAAFYCLAAFVLWAGGACGQRTLKDLFALTGVSALTCCWWYLGVLPRVRVPGGGDVFQFAMNSQALWQNEWSYYFEQLPVLLGWFGVVLAVVGAALAARMLIQKSDASMEAPRVWMVWPLGLLVPALVLISLVPNKVPWIVIALMPAWATLAAVAVARALAFVTALPKVPMPSFRPATVAVSAVLLAGAAFAASSRDYELMLRRVAPNQWRGAVNSREIAGVLNQHVRDGERVLLTSFHYWKGMPPGLPDPIFTCYLVKKPVVLLRSHQRPFDEVIADVRAYQLDWVLLSPEPGEAAALFGAFEQRLGLQSQRASGAWLFRTAGLHEHRPTTDTARVKL